MKGGGQKAQDEGRMTGRIRQETAVRRIRWKSDFEKKCLVANFERRGWRKCLEDEDE